MRHIIGQPVSPLRIALLYALLGSLWIVITGSLWSDAGQPPAALAQLERIKGLGFIAITSVLLYILLNSLSASANNIPSSALPSSPRADKLRLVLMLAAVASAVPLLALVILLSETPRLEADAYQDLETIAELKSEQVRSWLDERFSDGTALSQDPGFIEQVDLALNANRESARDVLQKRLTALRSAYRYHAVSLLDRQGQVWLQAGDAHPVDDALAHQHEGRHVLPNTVASGRASATATGLNHQFSLDTSQPENVHMHLLFDLQRSEDTPRLATLQLEVRADHFLFPYVTHWSDHHASGETLLVTAEDGQVHFLTPLRQSERLSALASRELGGSTLPAAVALRRGGSGRYRGDDYRNTDVLAAHHPVAGMPWQLIAKVDRSEVLAPLATLIAWVVAVGLLAVTFISLLIVHGRRQQHHLANLRVAMERRKSDALLQQFFDMPFIGIAISAPPDMAWLRVNDRLCDILGYHRDDLLNTPWCELVHPDESYADTEALDQLMHGDSASYRRDRRLLNKDGREMDTYLDTQCIRSIDGDVDYLITTVQDISERKAAEKQLQDSHQLLDFAIQQMPIPVLIARANRGITHINPASNALMARHTDDPTTIALADFHDYWPAYHPDGRPYQLAEFPLYRATRHGESIHDEEMLLRLPAGERWINASAAPLRDDDGNIVAGIVAYPDVTLQRQAQQALERLQQEAQQYLDIAGVILLALDRHGRIQMINRRGCELLGYDQQSLLGEDWFARCVPETISKDSRTRFDQLVADGVQTPDDIESPVIDCDGGEHLIVWQHTVIRDHHNHITGVLLSGEDVSRLRRSEARLRTLVDTIPDLIWLKDESGHYLACNPTFERFFGAKEADIIGKSDYDFVDRGLADFFREQDLKAIMAGKPSSNEETLTFATGDYHGTFETIKTPMYSADGRLTGILGIARDISERLEASKHLEYLNRLYATLSQTNKAIVRSRNDAELLQRICENAVRYGGFTMAWVGLLDKDKRTITPVCDYGDTTDYVKTLSVSNDPVEVVGLGPTGTAIREGRPYWCQDFLASDSTKPWHNQAKEAGFAASAALPLRRDGQVIGSLNIYAAERNAFDQQVCELLEEMAREVGYALDNFDNEKQRRDTEQRLALIIEGSTDSPWDWDLETDRFWDGSMWWNLLGYDAGDLPKNSQLWRELVHPDDAATVETELSRVINSSITSASVECRLRHKHGYYIPVLIRGLASRNNTGKAVRLTGTLTDLSERKQIEQQLRRQRDELMSAMQRLDSHLANTPLGVIEWDPDFRVVRWSARAAEIFGWQERDVLHKHPDELSFIFEDDANRVYDMVEQHLSGNLTQSHSTNRNYTRSGSVVDIEWFNSAIYDEQGKLLSLMSLAQDVTEQREAERRLRESESRFRLALSQLPIVVWQMDRDLRYTWVYDMNELENSVPQLGESDDQIYGKDDADYLSQLKQRVLETGAPISKEVYLSHDGELKFYNYYIEALKDEDGNIQGITGAAVDITAMRELQKSQKELSDALKQSASAIAMVDLELRFEFTNDAFNVLFGYDLDETTGRSVSLLSPSKELETLSETDVAEQVLQHKHVETELMVKNKAGEVFPVYLTAASLSDSDNKVTGFVAHFSDLRPLKQSEARLRDALSGTITAISHTLEKRDPYTAGHQQRVAELAVAIAEDMHLDPHCIEGIYLGSLIHDIGKIYIPAEILTRPGKLSHTEFELIKSHPEVGYEIIKHVKFEWPIAEIVYQHHERIDGSGYPQGLSAEQITLEAKIVAVADIVEAMTSHRPYRASLGLDAALSEIAKQGGKTLDQGVVDSCLRVFRDTHFEWSSEF